MDVSIVVVNWNVRELLKSCLESVYTYTKDISFELFVVDNNSNDGSAAMVAGSFPAAHLIANTANLGFASANNQAFTKCTGRYILLLNPDTELTDNTVKKMCSFMDAHPEADALGIKLTYPDGRLQPSCRHFPSIAIDFFESLYLDQAFPCSMIFNRYRMGCWKHDDTRQVDQPYGACLMFRKSTLDRIGFMDERFFMYYDEVELCYRLKRSGGKIFYTDTITVIHHGSQSSKQAISACDHYKHYSRLLFFEKHYGAWSVYVLTGNLIIRTLIAWGLFPLMHRIIGRPRDPEYFKEPARIMWEETRRYFSRGRKAGCQ